MREGKPQGVLCFEPATAQGLESGLVLQHRTKLLSGKLASGQCAPVTKDSGAHFDCFESVRVSLAHLRVRQVILAGPEVELRCEVLPDSSGSLHRERQEGGVQQTFHPGQPSGLVRLTLSP